MLSCVPTNCVSVGLRSYRVVYTEGTASHHFVANGHTLGGLKRHAVVVSVCVARASGRGSGGSSPQALRAAGKLGAFSSGGLAGEAFPCRSVQGVGRMCFLAAVELRALASCCPEAIRIS